MDNWTISILALFSAVIVVVFAIKYSAKRKWRAKFNDRTKISITKIHENDFKSYSYDDFLPLWKEVSNALQVDCEKLKATDRFDTELSFYSIIYNPIEDLYCFCEVFVARYDAAIEFNNLEDIYHLIVEMLRIKKGL